MAFQFDHLVHFTDSPEDAGERLKNIGLHVTTGGRHEDGGTFNTLTYFDLSYIELIGVFDRKAAEAPAEPYSLRDTFQKNHFNNGFSKIALRSDNLERDQEYFESVGLEVYGPVPLSRKRPDGSVLSWKLLYIGDGEHHLGLPFFIEWETSDDERRADLISRGNIKTHDKENFAFDSVGMVVKDAAETLKRWSRFFNLEADDEIFKDEHLNAEGHRLNLDGGDIIFYRPAGEGIAADILEENGETPFIVNIEASGEKGKYEVKNGIYRFI